MENKIAISFKSNQPSEQQQPILVNCNFQFAANLIEEVESIGHPVNLICLTLINLNSKACESHYINKDVIVFSTDFPVKDEKINGEFTVNIEKIFSTLSNETFHLYASMIKYISNALILDLNSKVIPPEK